MIRTMRPLGWLERAILFLACSVAAVAPAGPTRAAETEGDAAVDSTAARDSIVVPDSAAVAVADSLPAADSTSVADTSAVAPPGGSSTPAALGEADGIQRPVAVVETTMGTIEIELYSRRAPLTVENFRRYAQDGFYEGTVFHRVIPGYLIQAGGFTEDLWPKRTYTPIALEAPNGLSNERSTVAMARGRSASSATSQFFVNLQDNPSLDYPSVDGYGYVVFGRVVTGMDVVDRIAALPTVRKEVKNAAGVVLGEHRHAPTEAVVIQKVRVVP
jgi:peptidyl-prolyl cis-trans isomerase A (cyclophilin A)